MSDEPVLCNLVCVSKRTPVNSIPERARTQTMILGLYALGRFIVGSFIGSLGSSWRVTVLGWASLFQEASQATSRS